MNRNNQMVATRPASNFALFIRLVIGVPVAIISWTFLASAANAQTHYTITSLADIIGNDDVVTLREAIQAANTDSAFFDAPAGNGADFIEFHPDLFLFGPQTLEMGGSEFLIADDLTITGPGRDLLTIDANQLSRVFTIRDTVTSKMDATISDMTITGGLVAEPGGGIYTRENLTIKSAAITNNRSTTNIIGGDTYWNGGGGVYNFTGTLEIFDSIISDNFTSIRGGGVMGSTHSTTTITRCQITDNFAKFDGGGVGISHAGSMTINESTISGNWTNELHGGGVYGRESGTIGPVFLNIHDSVISNNMPGTNQHGGGIYTSRVTLVMSNTIVSNNTSEGISQIGSGSMTNCVITGNDSSRHSVASGRVGGGIHVFVESGVFEIIDSTITNNKAGDGGGIFIDGGSVTITGSTISGNTCITSSDGGGIAGAGLLTLANSTVSGNMAGPTGQGGGLHIGAGSWTVRNSTIANNEADVGGGIRVTGGTLSLDSTIVGDNVAPSLANDVSGTVSGQNNLVEDPIGAFLLDPNNIVNVDPGLKPLFDNGGPTLTHALSASSAAINSGSNPAGLLTDQRGQVREIGGRADIGAFETPLVLPYEYKLGDGILILGQLTDLFASDNLRLEMDPEPTKNPVKQQVELIVQSVGPTVAPNGLSFLIESRMSGGPPGDVIQTVELFDYKTHTWELVDSRAVTNSDKSIIIAPTGDLSRFASPTLAEITAMVKWKSESFVGTPFWWSIGVDQAGWFVTD